MSAWCRILIAILLAGGLRAGETWSPFAPVGDPRPPAPSTSSLARDPLDLFILDRLERAGLSPAPEVSPRAWLRRVTLDLTGLPPEPEDVERFLASPEPASLARARVVDRLLASPAFGEHWARHWLDVVRYAESDGFAIDSERPTLWRYRDYVVRSLNRGLPFDDFVREQLAGDEMPGREEGLISTGFYRLGPYEADNMIPENRRQDFLDEITSAVGSAFLGLTLECARCHDHKFDPVPTLDYYRLQAFLAPVKRADRPLEHLGDERTGAFERYRESAEAERKSRQAAHASFRQELLEKLATSRGVEVGKLDEKALQEALKAGKELGEEDRKKLESLGKRVNEHPEWSRVGATACSIETPDEKAPLPLTRVLVGGQVTSPGAEAFPGFPSAVEGRARRKSSQRPVTLEKAEPLLARGQRTRLADWIASDGNPLTPRVIVNRIWQRMVGVGLVATPGDFGLNGAGTRHPELLDRLTRDFLEGGWRLKPLIRRLALSRTYATSTVHADPEKAERVDPDNRLLWRGNARRLQAESIRDALLAVSGQLDRSLGGPGFLEKLPGEMGRNFPFFTWDPSPDSERRRRSIYMFQRRNLVHPFIEAFDPADSAASCSRRETSVTTPQAFTLLNGDLARVAAHELARRVEEEGGETIDEKIDFLFRRVFARSPDASELRDCRSFLEQADSVDRMSWHLARVLLNTSEFLHPE